MTRAEAMTKAIEIDGGFDRDWLTVAASAAGMMFSAGAVTLYPFGVFIGPIEHQFGWTRGQISGAVTVAQIALLVATLLWGILLDRFGPRRILLSSIVGLGIGLVLFSQLKAPLWHLYLVFALAPLLGAGANPVGYNGVLVRRFDRRLGIALGISLMGVGLGAAILPVLAQHFIAALGWRSAYAALAATAVGVGLPAAWTATRKVRGPVLRNSTVPVTPLLPLVRTRTFLLICGVFLLLGTAATGVLTQLIPMMTDRGMSAAAAAKTAALVGVSTLVSRGGVGWLLDKVHAPYLLAGIAAMCAGLCLLLLHAGGAGLYSAVSILLGLIGGAEIDFIGFLVRKYFGAIAFGRLYAVAFAAYVIGPGPLLIGHSFDRFHTYRPGLLLFAGMSVLASIFAIALPRYEQNEVAFERV